MRSIVLSWLSDALQALVAEPDFANSDLSSLRTVSYGAAPISVAELILAYWKHAERYYRKNGKPTSEQSAIKRALTVVNKLYGGTPAVEFGPRALGARSILGDPRSERMQTVMNLKIKFRESFRPFAPSVLREDVSDWFETDAASPYMLLVSGVHPNRRIEPDDDAEGRQNTAGLVGAQCRHCDPHRFRG